MEQSHTIQPFDAYRAAFAPVLRAQQEGLQAFGRFARFQYSIASDVLEHNLAGVRAAVSAASPVEYLATQGQLNVHFLQKVATHTCEFLQGSRQQSDAATSLVAHTTDSTNVPLLLEHGSGEFVQYEPAEEEQDANQLSEMSGNAEEEPEIQPLEAQPIEPVARSSTKARENKKRSEKSRRG